MRTLHTLSLIATALFLLLPAGCADETAGLKQKIAELEKKIDKQHKDFVELAGRLAPQKDFSSDIQRIEDQQERISQVLKSQVEPINTKLEEFRDWAQETQKEREENRQKLKSVTQSIADIHKAVDAESKEIQRLAKEFAAEKKRLASVGKSVEDLTKGMTEVRKEMLDNNAKLVEAVKKTLPKVRDSVLDQLKDRFTHLDTALKSFQTEIDKDRKAIETLQTRAQDPASGKDVTALMQRVKELEDVLASQKSYLLELGSQMHEVRLRVRQL
ncbi:MAG: hypothetical protein FJY85_26145, partial [Deltaproteobacteria bacterium]|nr:hypothetical protein [Deltaproteobacteria bacterium]